MNRVEIVSAVLMDNDAVRSCLYSEWDDGHDVGVLAERIVAALAIAADPPAATEVERLRFLVAHAHDCTEQCFQSPETCDRIGCGPACRCRLPAAASLVDPYPPLPATGARRAIDSLVDPAPTCAVSDPTCEHGRTGPHQHIPDGRFPIASRFCPGPADTPQPERSERGFAHFAAIESTYGGTISAYESSAADGPHVWVRTIYPEDMNEPHGKLLDGVAHLTLDSARQLRDQLSWLIENHYQRPAVPAPQPEQQR